MSGRKRRELTENEKDWEYRQMQRRGRGDHVVGEKAEFLEDRGAWAEKKREREEWNRQYEQERQPERTDTGELHARQQLEAQEEKGEVEAKKE